MSIVHNPVGLIDLNPDLDIETVTENSYSHQFPGSCAEVRLISQCQKLLLMRHMPEQFLRKSIDYFCHMAVSPEFYDKIAERDPEFVKSDFFPKMSWLRHEFDDIYDPSYTDILRVSFTSEFKGGDLKILLHCYLAEISRRSNTKNRLPKNHSAG